MGASIKVTTAFPPQSVEWKGVVYKPGETIPDLPAAEIKRFKALGAIEVVKPDGGGQTTEDSDSGGKAKKKE